MEPELLDFYDNELNAQEIKQRLADAEIECVLQNEMKTSVNVMSESAEEGVAVYVDKKDYSEAKKILDAYNQEFEDKGIWCPECESEDITKKIEFVRFKPRLLFIVCSLVFVVCIIFSLTYHFLVLPGIIFTLPLIVMIIGYKRKSYHCNKCGKDFTEKDMF